jgi:hypothetical protein
VTVTGTTWQGYPAGTPAPSDTLLFRDVSDNAVNAAGKVKQATVADLLSLLGGSGGTGGGDTGGGGTGTGSFTAVGDWTETTDTSFSWTPSAEGNVLIVIALSTEAANPVTALASGNATWTRVVSGVKAGSYTVTQETAFIGTATAVTEGTITLATQAAPGDLRILAHEFDPGGAVVTLDKFVTMDGDVSGAVTAWPSATPSGSAELLFGFERNFGDGDGAAVAGSTSGVEYYVDANDNGGAYAVDVDSATAVGWGDSDSRSALVLLLRAGAGSGGGGGGGGTGGTAYTQELYDNFSAASIDHGLWTFPDGTGGLTQSGGTLSLAAASSEHEIDTSGYFDTTAGVCAVKWSHTGTATPATTPGNDEGTQVYFGFADASDNYCELQLTPGSDFWVSWADGVGATVSGDTGDQTAFTTEWTDGDWIGFGDYDTGNDQRIHVYKSADGVTWTEIASFKITGKIDMSHTHFFFGAHEFTGSTDWVSIFDDMSFFERTGSPASGGAAATPPAAPLLGMYLTGNAFPAPGPSAWASGPRTNLTATYVAWDNTASDVAAFIAKCKANGLIPFVELEPWHFDQSAVLFSSITSGGSDSFLTAIGSAVAAAGVPVIFTFGHEMNISGQYPWSQGMTGSGPGGGALTAAEWIAGWKYVRDKVNSTANGLALWMWACSAYTGGTSIDPSDYWPGTSFLDMVGIDAYPSTQYGPTLGTFDGQIGPTVTIIRGLGWSGDIFLSETNLREMVDSGGQDITSFVADMHSNGVSGILEFEDASWGLKPMTTAQWTAYNNAVAANYGS